MARRHPSSKESSASGSTPHQDAASFTPSNSSTSNSFPSSKSHTRQSCTLDRRRPQHEPPEAIALERPGERSNQLASTSNRRSHRSYAAISANSSLLETRIGVQLERIPFKAAAMEERAQGACERCHDRDGAGLKDDLEDLAELTPSGAGGASS
jgi:hypothetical protein